MKIEMMDCENVLMQEIADPKCKRKTIARTYAFALKSSEDIDFKKVNMAIINRWSISGLEYIKSLAWSGKCFEDNELIRRRNELQ